MVIKISPFWFSVAAIVSIFLFPFKAGPAEGVGRIHGLVYVSPSGKLEGDLVMRGAGIEIRLLGKTEDFQTALMALRQSRTPVLNKQLQAVKQAQQDFLRASTGPRPEREEKGALLRQERFKLAELQTAHAEEVSELIAKHTFGKTKTDGEGRFNLTGIPKGHYLLYCHFEITGMAIHYYWLFPTEKKDSIDIEVRLSNLNATHLFK